MKQLLFFLCVALLPISTFAGTREVDMWTEFNNLIQPNPQMNFTQGNMSAKYIADEKSLTDKIVYARGGKTWTTKGPWSLANDSMRKKVRTCKSENPNLTASSCGWYDYKIIRLSPSGNYIELAGNGWESMIWRMLDTKTGKLILSNDNGVIKSMWTADKKQFIWQTGNCEIGGCKDPIGTFITEFGKFPKYKKQQ